MHCRFKPCISLYWHLHYLLLHLYLIGWHWNSLFSSLFTITSGHHLTGHWVVVQIDTRRLPPFHLFIAAAIVIAITCIAGSFALLFIGIFQPQALPSLLYSRRFAFGPLAAHCQTLKSLYFASITSLTSFFITTHCRHCLTGRRCWPFAAAAIAIWLLLAPDSLLLPFIAGLLLPAAAAVVHLLLAICCCLLGRRFCRC